MVLSPNFVKAPSTDSGSLPYEGGSVLSRAEGTSGAVALDSAMGGESLPAEVSDPYKSRSIATDSSFRCLLRPDPSGLLLDDEWSFAACDRTAFRFAADFESSGPLVLMKTKSEDMVLGAKQAGKRHSNTEITVESLRWPRDNGDALLFYPASLASREHRSRGMNLSPTIYSLSLFSSVVYPAYMGPA